ncbi:MAG: hypothetical protein RI906_747 [Pseudomonadota bacterium]|jgi:hypothetical protein
MHNAKALTRLCMPSRLFTHSNGRAPIRKPYGYTADFPTVCSREVMVPACDDLQVDKRYLVYPDQESFPTRHGTQVIGLAELMKRLAAQSQ